MENPHGPKDETGWDEGLMLSFGSGFVITDPIFIPVGHQSYIQVGRERGP